MLYSIGKHQFYEVRNKMLRYAIEMATSAQRDRFVENPVEQVRVEQYNEFLNMFQNKFYSIDKTDSITRGEISQLHHSRCI